MDSVSLLIKVYDYTILHCKKKDLARAGKGIIELMSSLNFEYEEISLGLFRLYQYCQDKIRQGEFNEAVHILEGLREAWVESLKRNKDKQVQ